MAANARFASLHQPHDPLDARLMQQVGDVRLWSTPLVD